MKKILALALTMVAASSFAQGTISFLNNASTLVKVGAVNAAVGSTFVQLFQVGEGYLGSPVNISPVAGRFNGGTVVADVAEGAPVTLQVRAWSSSFPTFEAANSSLQLGVFTGISSSWTQPTGAPSAVPAVTPVSIVGLPTYFTGVTLSQVVVPEPSTFALAGLGAAALLIFRRRA
jgi:hypothetical protein